MQSYLHGYPTKAIKRFQNFKEKHPQVYGHFVQMAKQIKSTGKHKYSARTIFEVLRWHLDLETHGEEFKISNDFIPMYVRLFIHENPDFEEFFTLRRKMS